MNGRETILQRIRSGLANAAAAGFSGVEPPPVPEVWPPDAAGPEQLVERFSAELKLVQGEPVRCPTIDAARQHVAQLMAAENWPRIGSVDRPAARELLGGLPADRVAWIDASWQPRQIAELPAGVIVADVLLADTGTCMIACPAAQDRLMCYLPPACVVLARVGQLAPHLPAAWGEIARRTADRDLRGEFVLVTGPSRTADIEKILILGVHGPKRLVVLMVD
jgi:L-lactate dehydrogenase complex protein LldG